MGPILGALLSDPDPRLSNYRLSYFLSVYHWALPNMMICLIIFPGLIGSILFLKVVDCGIKTNAKMLTIARKHLKTRAVNCGKLKNASKQLELQTFPCHIAMTLGKGSSCRRGR